MQAVCKQFASKPSWAASEEGCSRRAAHLRHVARTLRFGVATADHQCEAYDGHDDIRDVWERVRGLVARGKATDFWNRYGEDVELARGLGCTSLSAFAFVGAARA